MHMYSSLEPSNDCPRLFGPLGSDLRHEGDMVQVLSDAWEDPWFKHWSLRIAVKADVRGRSMILEPEAQSKQPPFQNCSNITSRVRQDISFRYVTASSWGENKLDVTGAASIIRFACAKPIVESCQVKHIGFKALNELGQLLPASTQAWQEIQECW